MVQVPHAPLFQNSWPRGNVVLDALPDAEYQRLERHLRTVCLSHGDIMHEEGEPPQYVYFLTEGAACLTLTTREGKELELSIVGNEGIMGERAIFEGGLPLIRCSMLTDGRGFKMPPQQFKEAFEQQQVLHDLVLRTLEARLVETSQTALCNQFHSMEERLSRWLLTLADRLRSPELPVTHEKMADMMGMRRSGISVAAGVLRDAGLIQYTRGQLEILDRQGLEESACECYAITREAVDRAYLRKHKS